MLAVEFEADTDNEVIIIPVEHRRALRSKHLKIIVLGYDEASNVKTRAVPRGYQAPVKVSSYKRIAKREEIYGR